MHVARKNALLTGTALAAPLVRRAFTRDAAMTYDAMTIDSTGAFLIGELERLDQTLHDPLVAVTWPRDIDLREDVTMGDEASSFTISGYAHPGGIVPGGKAWISKEATAISGPGVDIGKTVNPLYLWGSEVRYTIPELVSAQQLGRPIDVQKYDAMKLQHQMDVDAMVYVGDTYYGKTGMLNNASVAQTNFPNGASGSPLWSTKTPDEILSDINYLLISTYTNAGFAVVPDELRLPPVQFSYLASQKVSQAGNVSILEFVRNNSMCNAANGRPLNVQPIKWLTGAGVGGTNRMFVYSRDKNKVRFPMVPLQRTPLEFRSIWQITTYFGRLGCVEWVYPETAYYLDGI